MAVTDEVVALVRASRDRTVERTDQQVVALTRQWVDVWSDLRPEFADALTDVLATVGDDGVIPAAAVARNRRLGQAITRARAALDVLVDDAEKLIVNDLESIMLDAADAKLAALQAQLPPTAPGVTLGTLDPRALDAMVARASEQIHAASLPLADTTERLMKAELVRGIVIGANPNATARRIMQRTEGAFNGGLARAARIARTESLDAMRRADQETATANRNLIAANVWISTLDSRACPSCIGKHGTEWPVEDFGPLDHVQGRCVFVPRTKTWAELGFTGIEDDEPDRQAERDAWFDGLTTASQDRTLGKARADLLRSGDIGWSDLSKRVENPDWRPLFVATPVKDLVNR